jgi:SlyX protein
MVLAVGQYIFTAASLQRSALLLLTDMPTPTSALPEDVSDRLTNLEIKASFTEDLLDKLDQIIIRQQSQIDSLTQEVRWLRQQSPAEATAAPRSLRDELPPHY